VQRRLNDNIRTKRVIVATPLATAFFSFGDAVLTEDHAADPIPQPAGPWYR
jgi:hypothetical protein